MALKIILIILAALIGIVLLAVLAVLFVPIRYRLEAHCYKDDYLVRLKCSWLLHILQFQAGFYKGKTDKRISDGLFCKLYIAFVKKDFMADGDGKDKAKKTDKAGEAYNDDYVDGIDEALESNKTLEQETDRKSDVESDVEYSAGRETATTAGMADENITDAVEKSHTASYVSGSGETRELGVGDKNETCDSGTDDDFNINLDDKDTSELGFIEKIVSTVKGIFAKLASIPSKLESISSKFDNVSSKLDEISTKVKGACDKISDFCNNPDYRELYGFLKEQLKKLWRMIRPRKARLSVHYGFDDIETTGKVTMYLAIIYGIIGKDISIRPDFEEKVFEGELMLAGRIRLIGIVIMALRCFFDSNFKKYILKK